MQSLKQSSTGVDCSLEPTNFSYKQRLCSRRNQTAAWYFSSGRKILGHSRQMYLGICIIGFQHVCFNCCIVWNTFFSMSAQLCSDRELVKVLLAWVQCCDAGVNWFPLHLLILHIRERRCEICTKSVLPGQTMLNVVKKLPKHHIEKMQNW